MSDDDNIETSSHQKDLKSICDILNDPKKILGDEYFQVAKVFVSKNKKQKSEEPDMFSIKYVQISVESILFNGEECMLMRCQDLGRI